MEIKIHLPPWPRLRIWLFILLPILALTVFGLYLVASASVYSLIYPKTAPIGAASTGTVAATANSTATTPAAATTPTATSTQPAPDNLTLANQSLAANQFPEAYTAFKLVVASDPKNLSARSQLRVIALRLNKIADLKQFYEGLITANPNEPAYPLSLGTIYMTVDRNTEKARSLFEQSLKLDPNNGAARYNLGALQNY